MAADVGSAYLPPADAHGWCVAPYSILEVPLCSSKAACLAAQRTTSLVCTCPGVGLIPKELQETEEGEGAGEVMKEGCAAEQPKERWPRWAHCDMVNEPTEGRGRRCCGTSFCARLCANTDAAQRKRNMLKNKLRGGRSILLVVGNFCENAYTAATKKGTVAERSNGRKQELEAMCCLSLVRDNFAVNARLPTEWRNGVGVCGGGWMEVEGSGGTRCTDVRSAQGTHGTHHSSTPPRYNNHCAHAHIVSCLMWNRRDMWQPPPMQDGC